MEEDDAPKARALKELEAMKALTDALGDLDQESASRVIRWASEQFSSVTTRPASGARPASGNAAPSDDDAAVSMAQYEDLASFFATVGPSSGTEKALVVGYWHQVVEKKADLDAQALNSDLKHLGHQLPNVTVALTRLMEQKPALVMQIRKEGSTKQARKRYRLTSEGIRRVKELLAATRQEQ